MRTDSFRAQDQSRFAINTLPTVLLFTHHVFMREHVGFAFAAFQMPKRVIFAGIGLDDVEISMTAVSANVFHAL